MIGVGHSIGAIVTLRAALRYPKKFRALVLLDPVLYVPQRLVEWRVQRAKDPSTIPWIQAAQKRRRTFSDLETVFTGYRNREVFRFLSDDHLRIYIEGITRQTENGYELVYSPEWESRIYFTSLQDFDIWNSLHNLRVPTLFIRGDETDTFLEDAARLVQEKQPNARIEVVEKSTHIFPLERPKEVFNTKRLLEQRLAVAERRGHAVEERPGLGVLRVELQRVVEERPGLGEPPVAVEEARGLQERARDLPVLVAAAHDLAAPQFEDRPLPHAPAWSTSASVLLEPGGGWFARLDAFGRDNFYYDFDLSSGADRKSRDAGVVNLRAGREFGRWRVEAWVRNDFDEEYAVRGFYFGNEPPA